MTDATLVQKRTKVAGSGTKGPKPPSEGPISRDKIYPVDCFCRTTRIGRGGVRGLVRKRKLKVFKVGGVGFIRGSDFADLIDEMAGDAKTK